MNPPPADPILVIDDEAEIRTLLCRILERAGYTCDAAADAAEALEHLALRDYAMALCDVNMPGLSGIDLVREARRRHPDLAVIMVSGLDDAEVGSIALAVGAYGYVVKPFRQSELLLNVDNALRRVALERDARDRSRLLEAAVSERTGALRQALEELGSAVEEISRSREQTIQRLSWAMEFRSEETGGHIDRISRFSDILAGRLGTGETERDRIRIASPMHDIGKIGIPDRILLKPGALTAEERSVMQQHPEIGHRILAGGDGDLMATAAEIALAHHERFDGGGYPAGLSGWNIPFSGRLVAIVDVFDALTSDRVYRPAVPVPRVLEMMSAERGRHFDPEILDVFLENIEDFTTSETGSAQGVTA